MRIAKPLFQWFKEHRRDLPWRNTTNPYAIWLSEVILQQTRVDQGLAYYNKFLQLFPDVEALARAKEDEVLKAWQGLGYYSRARNLHAAAKMVIDNYGGQFPQSAAELRKLKGVGEYTAAAIASFCFREVVPVMDGNVMRVASRLLGIQAPVDRPEGRKEIMQALNNWIPPDQPDTFNQAIMEFGALQCTPKNPDCQDCPFKNDCVAFKLRLVDKLPFKAVKTKVKTLWMYYFVFESGDNILMRRRNADGIWKGLYDFPSLESEEPIQIGQVIDHRLAQQDQALQCRVMSVSEQPPHLLSHRKIHPTFIRISVNTCFTPEKDCRWVNPNELRLMGVSRLVDRYLQLS